MLMKFNKTLTADAIGEATFYPPEFITGEFLGVHIKRGTMTNFAVQLTAERDSIQRTLYNVTNPGDTDFTPVRTQAKDAAGAAIAGVYETFKLADEQLKVDLSGANDGETVDMSFIFEVKQFATHR